MLQLVLNRLAAGSVADVPCARSAGPIPHPVAAAFKAQSRHAEVREQLFAEGVAGPEQQPAGDDHGARVQHPRVVGVQAHQHQQVLGHGGHIDAELQRNVL